LFGLAQQALSADLPIRQIQKCVRVPIKSTIMSLKDKIASGLIQKGLPIINKKVGKTIQDNGLDPYQSVTHFETTIGSIGDSAITAALNLRNLSGLSSLTIRSIQLAKKELDADDHGASATTATFSIDFAKDLTMDISGSLNGKLKVSLGPFSVDKNQSVGLSATLTNSGSTIEGTADVEFGKLTDLEIKSIDITALTLKMGTNKVEFEGSLGIFDALTISAMDAISKQFQSELEGHISTALKMAIQDSLSAVMPMKLL